KVKALLERMQALGVIDAGQLSAALAQPIRFHTKGPRVAIAAPETRLVRSDVVTAEELAEESGPDPNDPGGEAGPSAEKAPSEPKPAPAAVPSKVAAPERAPAPVLPRELKAKSDEP